MDRWTNRPSCKSARNETVFRFRFRPVSNDPQTHGILAYDNRLLCIRKWDQQAAQVACRQLHPNGANVEAISATGSARWVDCL